MTEAEWLAATDPIPLFRQLRGGLTDRKLRLFTLACCRQIWPLLDYSPSRLAIEVASRYADGEATRTELEAARHTVEGWVYEYHLERGVAYAVCHEPPQVTGAISSIENLLSRQYEPERKDLRMRVGTVPTPRYTALVREIFGNPFRPIALDPQWLTFTVVALASGIEADRAFDRLPYLGDALQDAGCDNEDILQHCQSDGTHVHGCWVVEMLLGKMQQLLPHQEWLFG